MPVSWTVSAWSSSQSSPEAPVGTGFTTGIPTSPSTWLAAAPSTVGSNCSSMPPPFWPGRPAPPKPTPNLEFLQDTLKRSGALHLRHRHQPHRLQRPPALRLTSRETTWRNQHHDYQRSTSHVTRPRPELLHLTRR